MKQSTVPTLLKRARKLITPLDKWTQGSRAKNAYGSTGVHDSDAETFCALGAMERVIDPQSEEFSDLYVAMEGYLSRVAKNEFDRDIVSLNDDLNHPTRAHNNVLHVYDLAIERATADAIARSS